MGYALQLKQQQDVLEAFGTHFDIWFSEKSLYENDFFKHTQAKLLENGHVFIHEGATWLRTTDFGDDKDRVMIKSDGSFAYFASDSAYYISKRERELIGALGEYPRIVASAAELREPHRIARYVEELAGVYHRFYADCRVLPMGDESPSELHSARATLCKATAQVISNGLGLLGVTAPEKM